MTLYILEPTLCFFFSLYIPLLPLSILSLYSTSAWPPFEQSPTIDIMQDDGRNPHCNENRPLEASTSLDQQKKSAGNCTGSSEFVNHAAIAWEERRRKWIGDVSQRSHRMQMEPVISWSMTYEDLLSTNDPFTKPIPLSEMVDFLVDIWHDEDLFD